METKMKDGNFFVEIGGTLFPSLNISVLIKFYFYLCFNKFVISMLNFFYFTFYFFLSPLPSFIMSKIDFYLQNQFYYLLFRRLYSCFDFFLLKIYFNSYSTGWDTRELNVVFNFTIIFSHNYQ